ncbi:MAG: amidohydrolase family protein [Deltaproteobacteria bacterium]|jgi:predicted TIM-barrel fold metal-dependent hydrolase|nr:amidohydrolase family protein [Deltaproteobacteria bacterium]
MSNWLSDDEMQQVEGAEQHESPIPTRVVSNGEFNPMPQTGYQRRVEERIAALGDRYGRSRGMNRRDFLRSASGMAVAFLAMNEVYGGVFDVSEAEAADLEAAGERAARTAGQLIFDDQTHFNRDDLRHPEPIEVGHFAAKHWNPAMLDEMGIIHERFQFENYLKEIYLDSETSVALLSTVPFEDRPWLLSNEQMALSRDLVNGVARSRRMLIHSAFTPGIDGWMDDVDEALERFRPDSWKGYTIGDPLAPANAKHPWRLDDEKLVYPFFEKIQKAGINRVCIHKGLIPRDYEKSMKDVWRHATVDDVGPAARDWPGIDFVIYHSGLRPFVEIPDLNASEFERTGYIQWVSDLAKIPENFGVTNVYGEIGTSVANTVVTHPRLAAGMIGTLLKGLGQDHLLWGTDSTWYGSPQWQIEAFRRLEIPSDLQEKHGFEPLGGPNGAVKNAVFWDNGAKLYGLDREATLGAVTSDNIESIRAEYRTSGGKRSNRAYGYVHAG